MEKRQRVLSIIFQRRYVFQKIKKYGPFHGKDAFKQAIVNFYQRHYDVELDKEDEVCILYGTKMVLLHYLLVLLILVNCTFT